MLGETYSKALACSVGLHLALVLLGLIALKLGVDAKPTARAPAAVEVSLVAHLPTQPVSSQALEKPEPKQIKPKPNLESKSEPELKPETKPKSKSNPVKKTSPKKVSKPKAQSQPNKPSKPASEAKKQQTQPKDDKKRSPLFDPVDLDALAVAEADRLADEQSQLQEPLDDEAVLMEVERVKGLIRGRIEQYFTLPPSAKPDMFVLLEIELFPDGQVREVTLLESSENRNMDRSALRAVQSAGYFDVPEDIEIFQRYFRRFNFRFQPDLDIN